MKALFRPFSTLLEFSPQLLSNKEHIIAVESAKNDGFVQPIEKFGFKAAFQLSVDAARYI